MRETTLPLIEELLGKDVSPEIPADQPAHDVRGLQELELTYVGGGTYAGNLL